MRVPRMMLNLLLERGYQDATPEGEEVVLSGVELTESGGRCYVRVYSVSLLLRFLLKLN